MDVSKQALIIARNMIRVGLVNSIDPVKGTVKVFFPDKDNTVSSDLPLLSFEYNIPSVGDQVVCLFLGNGLERGFCLGSFYSDISPPPVTSENVYRKQFDDGTYIEYNKSNKTLQVASSKPITLKGNVKIEGNLEVNGTVSASNIGS